MYEPITGRCDLLLESGSDGEGKEAGERASGGKNVRGGGTVQAMACGWNPEG